MTQATMQDVLDVEREALTPEAAPQVLGLTEAMLEVLAATRAELKGRRLKLTTVQAVKFEVALEQVGRCCFALAADVRKEWRR